MRDIVFLIGPTASGKTALTAELAARIPCEIVNVDSALIYRGMDVGTAKPGKALRARLPHHLLDLRDPAQVYSAAEFCDDARGAVAEILDRGRIPVLVGGTMFYFHAFEHGLSAMPKADRTVRRELETQRRRAGPRALHDELAKIDSVSAARIHPNDAQRVQRALEVHRLSGRPLSEFRDAEKPRLGGRIRRVYLDFFERAGLHRRIEQRLDTMLDAGLVDEVAGLMLRGDLTPGLPSMRAVGYRQAWSHLSGRCTREEMRLRAIYASRQLAKRQLTWMRRMPPAPRHLVDRIKLPAIAAEIEKNIVMV